MIYGNGELLENKCRIVFVCDHTSEDPCVYYMEDKSGQKVCKYSGAYGVCNSKIANYNRVYLLFKNEIEVLHKKQEEKNG